MNWIADLFSRYWRNVHLIILLLISLLLTVGVPRVNSLVSEAAIAAFHYPFYSIKTSVADLMEVAEANQQLRGLLVEAELRNSALEEARRENERLRAVLGFEPPPGYRLVPARVIAVSGDKIPRAAVINRGSSDSLSIDLSIINQEGLIGRVIEVAPDKATVQLLTDPLNRVAARIADSREMGIVRFRLSEGMILDNFPIQSVAAPGDLILTSGLGGVYPSGLLIGTVTAIERPQDETFCNVRVEPAANFNSLEELFVLLPEQP